ncbi:MAG TPA: ABC transporter substrate-binding protein [Thermomicrobiales bacterium]|jgi:peptide/nickel transport system substrate-binding protein
MRRKQLWSILALVCLLAGMGASSAWAQSEPARTDILKIAFGARFEDPSNFNLENPTGASRSDTGLHQFVYEFFFYYNLQTGEYIPWLATGYEYSADFTSMTVHLRDGVTWNDGQPFTADDVVFTYDLYRKNPTMYWAQLANDAVKSVDKIDNLTVKFNLTKPNPRFHLNREAFPAVGIWSGAVILPKHIWEGQDPLTFKNNPPVGTGPYKLKNATETSITWDRNDDWWGGKVFGHMPGPKEIQMVNLGAESNVAFALTNDEIDTPFIGILSAGSFEQVAARNSNVSAWSKDAPYAWEDPCPRALMIQNAKPPLDKPEVRWAISSLIDRQKIVDLAYEGTTVPAWGVWPNYDGNKPYFDAISDLLQQYPVDKYDPDKAAQLFSQAGVKPSDLKLNYVVDSEANEDMKVAQVLSDQLSAAGISVTIQPLTGGALNDAILKGDYDIAMNAFCPGYIVENLDLFNSKNYKPLGQDAPYYEANSYRYQNPKLDEVVNKMFTVPADDTATLTKLYHDAMAIWLPDLPVVPLVQAPALVPFSSKYWTGWPSADDPWNMPVSWWATFNLVITGYPGKEAGEWVGGIKAAGSS